MNLYDINYHIQNLLQADDDGVLPDDVFDRLASLQMDESQKLENIACLIKNLSAESAAINQEIANLRKRKLATDRHADRLMAYVSDYMHLTDRSKFSSPRVVLSFRRSDAVEFTDVSLVPMAYKEVEYHTKKAEIKAAIKSGVEVPGAVLVERQNLQIK